MGRRGLLDLNGAVVVVTGASSGNGRAIAHAFAAHGARLVLAARGLRALEEAAAECRALGGEAIAVPTEVGDAASMAALAAAALEAFGGIDVWVNDAAVLHFGRLDETPAEVVDQVIRTNVIGYLNGSREALRLFRRVRRGVLINVGSILGAIGHPYTAPYVASKFAIRGLTESLREEVLDEPGIHVCAVLPAAIDTPIYQRAANFTGRRVRPIRLVHPPQVVAAAVVGLARRPRRRAYAGWSARPAVVGKALAPGLGERAVRLASDAMEIGPERAACSPGNVFRPVADGYRVSGGWRSRYRPSPAVGLVTLLAAGLAVGAATLAARRRPRR